MNPSSFLKLLLLGKIRVENTFTRIVSHVIQNSHKSVFASAFCTNCDVYLDKFIQIFYFVKLHFKLKLAKWFNVSFYVPLDLSKKIYRSTPKLKGVWNMPRKLLVPLLPHTLYMIAWQCFKIGRKCKFERLCKPYRSKSEPWKCRKKEWSDNTLHSSSSSSRWRTKPLPVSDTATITSRPDASLDNRTNIINEQGNDWFNFSPWPARDRSGDERRVTSRAGPQQHQQAATNNTVLSYRNRPLTNVWVVNFLHLFAIDRKVRTNKKMRPSASPEKKTTH